MYFSQFKYTGAYRRLDDKNELLQQWGGVASGCQDVAVKLPRRFPACCYGVARVFIFNIQHSYLI